MRWSVKALSLRRGLITCSFLLIVMATLGLIFTWVALKHLGEDIRRVAMTRQERDLAVAWDVIRHQGTEFRILNGSLYAGDRQLNGALYLVDHIQDMLGGVATIFMGDERIATNVIGRNGARALGTKLARGPVYDAIFRDHRPFRGETDILGQPYFAAYDPILNAQGDVIGILFVGIRQSEFLDPVSKVVWSLIDFIIVMMIGVAAISGFMMRRIIRPVSIIENAMQRLARNDPAAGFDSAKVHADFGNLPIPGMTVASNRLFQDYPPQAATDATGGLGSDRRIDEIGRIFQSFVDTIEKREVAALASERRLADIINLLPDATMVIDINGRVLFWNQAMEAMTGTRAAEIIGKDNYEYALPFYRQRRPILIDMVLKPDAFIPGAYPEFEPRGDTIWGETEIPDFRGHRVSLRGSASVLRDGDGRVVGAIETIFDVTDRRRIIEDLRDARDAAERARADAQASERRLADIINLLPDATMVIDIHGHVLFWNRAMEQMTGVQAVTMVGKGNYEYALPFYGKRRPILIDMVLRPNAFIPGVYPEFEPRGDTLWAEGEIPDFRGRKIALCGSASVFRNSDGRVIGAIETIFDITERRQLIEDLREARDVAERASQAKSAFLATMSHELRTPLNSIIGFTQFVTSQTFGPVGDPQYIEHAEYANQSARHLLDIINGMLDFSKIEGGMMRIERVRVPVLPIVKRSIRMVQDLALQAEVTIKAAIPSHIPDLWADERALRQILINLLGNAIKFNIRRGSILVTALEAEGFVDLVIADTGYGIPEEALSRVRKPFEQIDNQYSRAQGGTGLGLPIVEGLVNLHGGALTIASELGKGTAVTARLPAAPALPQNQQIDAPTDFDSRLSDDAAPKTWH